MLIGWNCLDWPIPSIRSIQAIPGGGSELPELTGLTGLTRFHHHINSLLLSPPRPASRPVFDNLDWISGIPTLTASLSGLMGRLCYVQLQGTFRKARIETLTT
jgi:hypothetical protein